MEKIINMLKFDSNGLIPAVVQNKDTKEILMVAYMNADTIRQTAETGRATFWSRSRNEVWVKGETSKNYMYVDEIRVDCDCDCLVVLAVPAGPACHTGNRTCFYRSVSGDSLVNAEDKEDLSDVMAVDQAVIIDRKKTPEQGR
ncbi:MAG: phosphoribosyl-AMP cyclohydrolase [Oscillospiraceae bacterium]|nr:phosphoribosyl-AMP cyclohydrolase [Oscillospiraceae bacterium]